MRNIFIYSGFVVAVLMIVMGTVMIVTPNNPGKIQMIPYEILGVLMIAWGVFRGYRSYVAYKNAKWEAMHEEKSGQD
jgi:predicted membrane chloride channel (bestrophin family)